MKIVLDYLASNTAIASSPELMGWVDRANKVLTAREVASPVIRSELLSVVKADEESEGGEGGGDDFLAEELLLSATLAQAFTRQAEEVRPGLLSVFSTQKAAGDFDFSTDRLTDEIEKAKPKMASVLTATEVGVVKLVLDTAMLKGGRAANAEQVLRAFSRRDTILDGMVNSAKYFTNRHFNEHIIPALWEDVQKVINGNDPNDRSAYDGIREAMEKRLKSVPYWRTVANAAASRAYHYGVVRGGREAGYSGYRFRALMDQRTSTICKTYNGRTFWLADALDIMERVASAEGDDVKRIQPWMSEKAARGLTEGEIRARGPVLPPLHGRCRSSIELLGY